MTRFIIASMILCFLSLEGLAQSKILFSKSSGKLNSGGTLDLMIYDPITKSTNLLVKGSVKGRGEYNAATSPDNSKIIFNTYRFSGWKLGIADFKDGKLSNTRKATGRSNYEYNAKYSPDGNRIVYEEFNWGTRRTTIFVANKDGKKVTPLKNASDYDVTPDWTQNGKEIVFASGRNDNYDIFIQPFQGEIATNLTSGDANEFAPSTSRSSNKIAFLSDREGKINLFVMNTDGGELKNLTPELNTDSFNNEGFWAYKTSWSPSGQQIVFNALQGGDLELFIVNADGTGLTQVTKNNDTDMTPFWMN
ncbi:MAG: PD40 domain-containing protein [Balneolaceae bacterium]|nr:PD40 domain-containing protein [Balneolaceae bacterium]MBO6545994.1 PD40 domain-containing protein [Balneolaceae bacterium]MBO6647390.1 PD40 domain-containing protein [Balneolaceae bacterium]